MRKTLIAAVFAAAAVILAAPAQAHTGTIQAQEDCYTWSVTVSLDDNVSADRTYEVTTDIPGTTGTSGTGPGPKVVAEYSGDAPATGTVTLTIDSGTEQEFTTSASISPAEDCDQPAEVAPPILAERSCDKPDTVTVPEQAHVTATINGPLSGPGHLEVDFTADEGYFIAEGTQTHFEFDLRDTKVCESPTPTPSPSHTPTPHKPHKPKPQGTAMTGLSKPWAIAAMIGCTLFGFGLLRIARKPKLS